MSYYVICFNIFYGIRNCYKLKQTRQGAYVNTTGRKYLHDRTKTATRPVVFLTFPKQNMLLAR